MSEINNVLLLHKRFVYLTPEKTLVGNMTIQVATLTEYVARALNIMDRKVYLSTRALKHMYDKKPAQEYDVVIANLEQFVRSPKQIFTNKSGRRGNLVFTNTLNGENYLCAIEQVTERPYNGCHIVTSFRIRKDNYLKNYRMLWSWKGDIPSS